MRVILLPVLSTLVGIGQYFVALHSPIELTSSSQVFCAFSITQQSGVNLSSITNSTAVVNWATPYFSTTLVTTVVTTSLIVFRIWSVNRANKRVRGGYRGVIEVVIESAALYSLNLVIYLPYLVGKNPRCAFAQAALAQITVRAL